MTRQDGFACLPDAELCIGRKPQIARAHLRQTWLGQKRARPAVTKDGKFGVEFAECLASCGTGPVMMCNDDFYEAVSNEESEEILKKYDA